jgi:ParB family chromosome partitioning protein
MKRRHELKVQTLPIDKITVVNARSRGQTKFRQIVSNISHIGLKKPLTVARRTGPDGAITYDLVCGQGRLEAFMALGQKEVPAIVVEADAEELLLMSLTENMARRQRTSIEMAREIAALHERGNSIKEVARKVDLDPTYVRGIIRLLKDGEERLLRAVERRQIPLSMAIEIAESSDPDIQRMLSDAYSKKVLKSRDILICRKLIELRRVKGKAIYGRAHAEQEATSDTLLKVHKKETARLRLLVNRAQRADTCLQYLVTAFRKLLADKAFLDLLKAEGLSALPTPLASQLAKSGGARARR